MNDEVGRKFVDVFLANDEINLATQRIEYLQPLVSKTVIGESGLSFSGAKKPLHFSLQKARGLLPPDVEVIEIPIPQNLIQSHNRWDIEEYSREYLLENSAKLYPETILIFSDLDEIPSLEQVMALPDALRFSKVRSLPLVQCSHFVNLIQPAAFRVRIKPKALLSEAVRPRLRYRFSLPLTAKPGVHLSYLKMSADEIIRKHANFSHSELDISLFGDQQFIEKCLALRVDPRGRFWRYGSGLLTCLSHVKWNEMQKRVAEGDPGTIWEPSESEPGLWERLRWSYGVTKALSIAAQRTFSENLPSLRSVQKEASVSALVLLSSLIVQYSGAAFLFRVARRLLVFCALVIKERTDVYRMGRGRS